MGSNLDLIALIKWRECLPVRVVLRPEAALKCTNTELIPRPLP